MKLMLLTLSLPLAWILAPESLVLLGNIAGQGGSIIFLLLPAAALLMLLMVVSTANNSFESEQTENTGPASGIISTIAASTLALSARIPVILLASTAMLVTAGFVFNEVFVYWFPNFGFAFLLLGLILLLNLTGKSWAIAGQVLFVSIALCALLILIIIGLLGYGEATVVNQQQGKGSLSLFPGVSCLLLFLGVDLYAPRQQGGSLAGRIVALILILLISLLWAYVSQLYVPSEKLMNSTIPYTLAARSIAGEPGRLLIGAAIIAGACGVVNALFISWLFLADNLSAQQLAPRILGTVWGGRILHLLFAIAIGVMMMTGLAGEKHLETYLRGALLLWLLHMGLRPFFFNRVGNQLSDIKNLFRLSVSVLFLLAFAYLLLADQQAALLLRFCVTTLAGGILLGVTALALGRMGDPKPPTQQLTEDAP